MKYRLCNLMESALAALVVLAMFTIPADAQTRPAAAANSAKKAGPTPRAADGHPDRLGIWWPGNGNPRIC